MDNLGFKIILLFLLTFLVQKGQAQDSTILHVDSLDLQDSYMKEMRSVGTFRHRQIEVTEDLVRKVLDRQPAFAVYKDSYMVTGIPLNKPISRSSADAFFQFSIRQRVTKSILPFNSFLYVTYTQKAYWNLYDESSPFRDNNYNPGVGVGKYVIKNNKLQGAFLILFEHESNGKSGLESRSWNFINFSAKYFYNMRLSAKAQLYLPYVDSANNKDLLRYKGYGIISVNYIDKNNLWWLSLDMMPRDKIINPNIHASLSYRISKSANQYLSLDFYSGYGEGLLEYKKYTSQIRLGFTIKPDFFSAY